MRAPPKNFVSPSRTIEVTEDHLRLLQAIQIRAGDDIAQAITHPFGDTNAPLSVAKLLGWSLFEDKHGNFHLTRAQADLARKLLSEIVPTLAICLSRLEFKTGTYVVQNKDGCCTWLSSSFASNPSPPIETPQ